MPRAGREDVTDGDTHADPRRPGRDGQARGLKQLSRQVDAPPALVEAILERLIALGKVERVAAQSSGGCGGGCKGCAQRDPCAEPEPYFRLR